jgi:hypothetical protein
MRRLFRPSLLVALSAAVIVGAAAVVFQAAPPANRPTVLPVADGDREIVWLYPATAAANWERFVAAVRRTGDRLRAEQPGLTVDAAAAFPPHTTTTPEVALAWRPAGRRLVLRWYKLTSDWKTRDWVEALLHRRPAPLAVVGGNTSDAALDLAGYLRDATASLPDAQRPLLLLTSATADYVSRENEFAPGADPSALQPELGDLYKGRTFRFCFTNKQMAAAVTQFSSGSGTTCGPTATRCTSSAGTTTPTRATCGTASSMPCKTLRPARRWPTGCGRRAAWPTAACRA